MDLHQLLERPDPYFGDRLLARAASHPGVLAPWVRDGLARRGLAPPTLRVADPLILTGSSGGGCVWRVAREGEHAGVPLAPDAEAAWHTALRVVPLALPLVTDPSALAPAPPPKLTLLYQVEGQNAVQGTSCGLAFALLHVSRAARVPIPTEFAASAALDDRGGLHRIDLLDDKLNALRRWAPGVRKVVVAADQPLPHAADFEFVRAEDLVDAIERVFGPNVRADGTDVDASRFYDLVLNEPGSPLRWRAVARGTAALLSALSDPTARWHVGVAHAVASRHAGEPLDLPASPAGLRIPRPERLRLLAHRVQAATDAVTEDWRALAEHARGQVAGPGDEHPEDLMLLGALGRLHAAWGEWDVAGGALERAVEGWFLCRRPGDASRPICELVRIAGLHPDERLLATAAGLAEACIRAEGTAGHSRGFLRLALGRAWASRGDTVRAAVALANDAAPWHTTAPHVRASRLRWLARVTGAVEHEQELRALVAREPDVGFVLSLARADREGVLPAGLSPAEQRQLERCARIEPAATARRILELFPY